MSAGGIWNTGFTTGLDWNDCQTTGGNCIGSQDTLSPRYADDLAQLKSSAFAASPGQWARATQFIVPGYTGNSGSHECELHLYQEITPHGARSYECTIGINAGAPDGVYVFVVLWPGAAGEFTTLYDPHGGVGSYINTPTFPVSGDRWYAQVTTSGVITLEQNEIVIGTVTDTTWTSGQPGLGFWPVDGAVKTSMGWSSWQCGNL